MYSCSKESVGEKGAGKTDRKRQPAQKAMRISCAWGRLKTIQAWLRSPGNSRSTRSFQELWTRRLLLRGLLACELTVHPAPTINDRLAFDPRLDGRPKVSIAMLSRPISKLCFADPIFSATSKSLKPFMTRSAFTHWPWKGESQKGNAQRVHFESLKSDPKVTSKWFHGGIPFCGSPFSGPAIHLLTMTNEIGTPAN